MNSKRGQVWIETVIYTVIGLSLIGIVLALVTPKINDYRDKITVEQSISALTAMDDRINEVLKATSYRRTVDFTIKRGSLYINSSADEIILAIDDLSKPYSEPGVTIKQGRVEVLSIEEKNQRSVYLKLNYKNNLGNSYLNITYKGLEESTKFNTAPTPYKFSITNEGSDGNSPVKIDIEEVSGN